MKNKIIAVICLFSFLLSMFTVVISANDDARNWYFKRCGNNTPSFPHDSQMVMENGGVFIGNTNEKKIYLTFDAGYENGNVEKILDILKEKNVPGAFFILKNVVLSNPDLIKRMDSEGHLVCNHTKNHKDMTTLTDEEMRLNLKLLDDLCYEKTGVKISPFFRFPEGRYNERTVKNASKFGYTTVFWSLSYADWDNNNQKNDDFAINKLISNTHNGAIVLLHPTSETNVRILGTVIDTWRQMGYSFGSLDELVA